MWFEFVRAAASFAVALSWLIGAALSFVMLMAVTEPMHASARAILARVWAWARRALSVALRAFVWVVKLPYGIAVTYLHIPTVKRPAHRFSRVLAWHEGTYSSKGVTA